MVERHRGIFYKVKDFLTLRQILLFTVNILYFSFDEHQLQLDDILKAYEIQVLKRPFLGEKIFLFFDEIHKPLL